MAAQFVADYGKDDASVRMIAAEHGVSYGTVHRHLVQAGVEMRGHGPRKQAGQRRMTPEMAKKVAQFIVDYEGGASVRAIEAKRGIGYGTVYRRLVQADVEMRPRGVRRPRTWLRAGGPDDADTGHS